MNMKRIFRRVKIYSDIACFRNALVSRTLDIFVSHEVSSQKSPRADPRDPITGAILHRGVVHLFRHTSPGLFYRALFVPLFPKARTALASFRGAKTHRRKERVSFSDS